MNCIDIKYCCNFRGRYVHFGLWWTEEVTKILIFIVVNPKLPKHKWQSGSGITLAKIVATW